MDASPQSLLARPAWIKNLARSLASNRDQADDLVQDTWVAALSRPPRRGVPLRRWVARVMRNSLIQSRRTEKSRRQREASVARRELDLSAHELLVRLDLQRSIADAVSELREPYRSAILLRYFEEIPPREIAERLEVPVRTVHSRVHRGLLLLRARLEPRGDDEQQAWMVALGTLARGAKPVEIPIAGALIMSVKWKVAAGLVAAIGLFFLVRSPLTRQWRPVREPDKSLAAVPVLQQTTLPVLEGPSDKEGRHAVEPDSAPQGAAQRVTTAAVQLEPLAGQVIDLAGFSVAGVPVVYVPFGREPEGFEPVISDGHGRFEFRDPFSSGQIDAVGDVWATVLQPRRLDGVRDEPILVVAPAITLAGVVVDEGGAPVPGARLSLGLPGGLRSKLNAIVDESHTKEWETRSDELGWFEFQRAPGVAGTRLHVSARGFLDHHQPLPLAGQASLEVELVRSAEAIALLEGRILDPEHRPVPGAWAALGDDSARADEDGFFRLEALDPGEGRILRATARGFLATELAGRPGGELRHAFPDPLVLVLSNRPSQLVGRVLDDRGRPVAGAQVWTPDETPFGEIPLDPDADDEWSVTQTIEALARGDHPMFSEHATTDAEGRFKLEGLMLHPYVVCAWDERTHAFAQSDPTATVDRGGFAEIRLPPTGVRPRVSGIVRGLGGDPIVGAEVELGTVVEIRPSRGANAPHAEQRYGSYQAVTDEEGRFRLADVPLSARWIHIDAESMAEGHAELLATGADFEALEFQLPLRCRMQVILTPGVRATRMQVLDRDGEPIALVVKHGWIATGSHWQDFDDERSEILRVSERAQTLVLYDGEAELTRQPLLLDPGELLVVRP